MSERTLDENETKKEQKIMRSLMEDEGELSNAALCKRI